MAKSSQADSKMQVCERYNKPWKGNIFYTYSYIVRYFDTEVPITVSVFENNSHLKWQTFYELAPTANYSHNISAGNLPKFRLPFTRILYCSHIFTTSVVVLSSAGHYSYSQDGLEVKPSHFPA